MKTIVISVLVVATLLAIMFVDFAPKATVITPEIKKTGNYDRPVKEGNCYIQTDTAGNKIRVCG